MRIRLLIADGDTSYLKRINDILVEEYYDVLDTTICLSRERLQELAVSARFDIGLISCDFVSADVIHCIRMPLLLWDHTKDQVKPADLPTIRKYQRVSKLINQVLNKYAAISPGYGNEDQNYGAVWGFWSPGGGCGQTALAIGCASKEAALGKRVLYLDLESFSSAPSYFQEPGNSISAVFELLEGNVELAIQSNMTLDARTGVYFFGVPENYGDISALDCEDIQKLVRAAASYVDLVVIDMFDGYDERVKMLFEYADRLFFVYDQTIVSQKKLLQFIAQSGGISQFDNKVRILANKGAETAILNEVKPISIPIYQGSTSAICAALSSVSYGE